MSQELHKELVSIAERGLSLAVRRAKTNQDRGNRSAQLWDTLRKKTLDTS